MSEREIERERGGGGAGGLNVQQRSTSYRTVGKVGRYIIDGSAR